MKRFHVWAIFTCLLPVLGMGCAQQCFMTEQDWQKMCNCAGLAPRGEIEAAKDLRQIMQPGPAPTTVIETEREPRYITLSETIAIALERGSVGVQSVRSPGAINDDLVTVLPGGAGATLTNVDAIRVLTMNAAIAGLGIDAALSRFDVKWANGITWTHTDDPVQGFNSFSNGDAAQFNTTLLKPLPTGGVAGITLATGYQDLARPSTTFPVQNPAWSPKVQFTFEHPLWQSFGIETNQMLPRNPGSTVGSQLPGAAQASLGSSGNVTNSEGTSGIPNTGIIVARIRFDQSRADLERVISFQLLNVETAYWNLYGAYVNLYTSELVLRQAREVWQITKQNFEGGKFTAQDLAQIQGQYELFRGDRLKAVDAVLEAERVLRGFMGLRAEDGTRLVPVDSPTMAPYVPDWSAAYTEALSNRPELIAARQELRTQQLNLRTLQNFLKPDLKFLSAYSVSALGSRLDGDSSVFDLSTQSTRSSNALRNLASTHYNDFTAGLVLNVPIGYRYENASIRRARLVLAQNYLSLKNEEEKAERFLTKAYRDVFGLYNQIGARRSQRLAYTEQLEALLSLVKGGKKVPDLTFIQAQRDFASAVLSEVQAIVAYNNALATFEFAKGNLLQHDNVAINEGLLPECVVERAVDHENRRTRAFVLRERSNLAMNPFCGPGGVAGLLMTNNAPPSALTLVETSPPLPPELNEKPLIRTAPVVPTPAVGQVTSNATGRMVPTAPPVILPVSATIRPAPSGAAQLGAPLQ